MFPELLLSKKERYEQACLCRRQVFLPVGVVLLITLSAFQAQAEEAIAAPSTPYSLPTIPTTLQSSSADHVQLALGGRGRIRESTAYARKINPLSEREEYWTTAEQAREIKTERKREYQRRVEQWQRQKQAERLREQRRKERARRRR